MKNTSSYKITLTLSVMALILKLMGSFDRFLKFTPIDDDYALSLEVPDIMTIGHLLIGLVPYVLFLLYIFKFKSAKKGYILLPITIFFMMLLPILAYFSLEQPSSIYLVMSGLYIPVMISSLCGFSYKLLTLTSTVGNMLLSLVAIVSVVRLGYSLYSGILFLHLFTNFAKALAPVMLNNILLIYGLENTIPRIIPQKKKPD